MRRALAALVALCVAAAMLAMPASAGETAVVSPPKIFKSNLSSVKSDSSISAVYLPSHIRVFTRASRVRGSVDASDNQYNLILGIGSRCNGANVCLLANFAAIRDERPASGGRRVRLSRGTTGYWRDISCGASCSPAEIQFVKRGVLYSIATKGVTQRNVKATLVKLANSAIEAGPR
jgi:hypothetical protein